MRFLGTFFAVLLALFLFGACTVYIVAELRMEKVFTIGGQRICQTTDILGNVYSQGPCEDK